MATYQWIGATGGAWGTTTNWSPTGLPAAGDIALATTNASSAFTIAVGATAIPALAGLTLGDSAAPFNPMTYTVTTGSWALGASPAVVPLTIDGTANTIFSNYVDWRPALTGSATLQKLGNGTVAFTTTNSPSFTGAVLVDAGYIAFDANRFSAASSITLKDNTGIANWSPTASYTITTPVTIHSTATLVEFNTNAATTTGVLTFNGQLTINAANPTLKIGVNAGAGVVLSGPITGTAGFTKAGTGALYLTNASSTNTISGTVTVSTDAGIYLNNTNSGVVNQLKDVGTFNFTSQFAFIAYLGSTGFTQNSAFTNSVSGYGRVISYNAGGITLNDASVGTFSGTFFAIGDATYTAPKIAFGVVPANAAAISLNSYASGATAVSTTATFAHTSASATTTPITIETATASATGHVAILEDNGAASTSFGGNVTKTGGASSAATLRLTGTNTSSTISGIIANSVGTLAVNKQGTGKWILSGANTYTGTTSVSAGTLSAQSAGAFGTSGAVTQTGGTIDVSGGVALTKTGAAFTLISAAGANALTTTTGTNTLACAGITLSSTIIVDAAAGASLTVNNTAAMSGAFGITKNNSGEIGLGTFANTYTGAVTVAAGTLTVGNLQNTSTASSLGTGALSSAIALTGTLKYAGTAPAGHSTNRSLTFTGAAPVLDASGTGAVTYSAATQAPGARTITLTGTSLAAVNNTFSATLADGTGAVGVAKTGSNKWVLSGALNHTGTSSCVEGTLNFGSTNRSLSGALSVSGGTVENSTNTISANTTMTGGTITAELTGNKTLDVNSGSAATLQPTNNGNTFSGATTVAAGGILRLITGANPTTAGAGRVLGTSAVSVSGDIKTSSTGAQRGQMRYGGNLTFNTGAKLYVGGA